MNSTATKTKVIFPTIVMVHGTGAYGLELFWWRRRLHRRGYRTCVCSYSPYRQTLEECAQKLSELVAAQKAPIVHFVGHSLGGLVILRYLTDNPDQRCGRVVNIATAHSGSLAARRVMRIPLGRWILGKSLCQTCDTGVPFPPDREIGAIAGTFNFMIGWFLWLPRPNDSLITVQDVDHPMLTDIVRLRVSHASSLLSRAVVRQIDNFLRNGVFDQGNQTTTKSAHCENSGRKMTTTKGAKHAKNQDHA